MYADTDFKAAMKLNKKCIELGIKPRNPGIWVDNGERKVCNFFYVFTHFLKARNPFYKDISEKIPHTIDACVFSTGKEKLTDEQNKFETQFRVEK